MIHSEEGKQALLEATSRRCSKGEEMFSHVKPCSWVKKEETREFNIGLSNEEEALIPVALTRTIL